MLFRIRNIIAAVFVFLAPQAAAIAADLPDIEYKIYTPKGFNAVKGIVVLVHGKSYNWDNYLDWGKEIGDALKMVVVAPVFRKEKWPDYAVLFNGGLRGDQYLDKILEQVEQKTGADRSKLFLYGHSGGAQFVHRYALCHPDKVQKTYISGPGWWTFPYDNLNYPSGFGMNQSFPEDVDLDMKTLGKVSFRISIGEQDTEESSGALEEIVGCSRLETAFHWASAMNACFFENGIKNRVAVNLVSGCGHDDIRGYEKKDVIKFFRGDSVPQLGDVFIQAVTNGKDNGFTLVCRSKLAPYYLYRTGTLSREGDLYYVENDFKKGSDGLYRWKLPKGFWPGMRPVFYRLYSKDNTFLGVGARVRY